MEVALMQHGFLYQKYKEILWINFFCYLFFPSYKSWFYSMWLIIDQLMLFIIIIIP